ncbi:hypothetical protein AW089_26115 [Escherichia coli]|nr:hypothetical protein AW089_26115 [Escherichia coli]
MGYFPFSKRTPIRPPGTFFYHWDSGHNGAPCLPLTLPLTGCVEDFHLLVVLQPPLLKNSASHGAHKNEPYENIGFVRHQSSLQNTAFRT